MSDISTKLTYLNTTKSKIKDSINLTGVGITTEPFRNYAIILKDKLAESIGDAESFREVLINNFPKDSDTGTSMSFNAYSSWIDYTLEGQTSQNGTPTPSSPIEVKTTTGRQVFQTTNGIDTQSYEINLGKNLFDITQTPKLLQRVTINISDNDLIVTPSGTYARVEYYLKNLINNETYTLSFGYTNPNGNSINVRKFNSSGTQEKSTDTKTDSSGNLILSFTYHNGDYIGFYANASGTSITTPVTFTNIQVEKGNYTSYSPYFPPIELCKIGTYQDKIYKDNGKWYLYKTIGKYIFNGTENWYTQSYGTNSWAVNGIINTISNDNIKLVISNIFKGIAKADRNQEIQNSTYANNTNDIYIRNTPFTSKANVQSATNGNYVYYVLATPTTTEITDSELLEQLEEVKPLNGLNMISITGDLPFISTITYLKKEG